MLRILTNKQFLIVFLFFLLFLKVIHGQININSLGISGVYNENFSAIATGGYTDGSTQTWNNNTTLLGWYLTKNDGSSGFLYRTTLTTAINNGNFYVFEGVGGGTDKSVGTRPSGTSPNNNLYMGMRLLNNTAIAVSSVYISYTAEQWSIAENYNATNCSGFPGSYCPNRYFFAYQQGVTVTSLTTGAYTAVSSLDFLPLHSCTLAVCTGTSAQRVILDGNQSSNRTIVSGCIDVSIPVNEEIMMRWYDPDDFSNDHHKQIDDISAAMYSLACTVVLPAELREFTVFSNGYNNVIRWISESENNVNAYYLEHSLNGQQFEEIAKIKAIGNSNQPTAYEIVDENPLLGLHYYRLKIENNDGSIAYSAIRSVQIMHELQNSFLTYWYDQNHFVIELPGFPKENTSYEILNLNGQLLQTGVITKEKSIIESKDWQKGIYLVCLKTQNKVLTQKLFLF